MRWPRLIICLPLLISGLSASANEWELLQPPEARLLLTMITAPLSPSLSLVSFDLPLNALSSGKPWSRMGASFWIISDSPYLIPRSYFELGFLIDWAFIVRSRQRLTAGLGSAVGIETLQSSVSIPLVIRVKYRYAVLRWMSLEAMADALVFGQGGGFQLHLLAVSQPFNRGIILGFGIGYGFLSEWDFNPRGDALQLGLSVGYAWPATRGARK